MVELKKRIDYDLAVLGIGAVKNTFNNTDGIKLDYVDPANLIWSYTEDPNFENCYYFGEVKRISLNELKKEFPALPDEEILYITIHSDSAAAANTQILISDFGLETNHQDRIQRRRE